MVQAVDAEQERTSRCSRNGSTRTAASLNFAGVNKVGDMLRAELEPLGFSVEWIDMKETGRAGHIVARHKGNGRGKRLLLIGHLDTVFEPDCPFQRWDRRGNRRRSAPGAGDDKGGMAVMVAALRAMQAAGTLKNADITVFLTGDEEDAGTDRDRPPRPDRRRQARRRRARFRRAGRRNRARTWARSPGAARTTGR